MDCKCVVIRLEKLHLIRRILRQKGTMNFPLYPGQLHLLEYVKAKEGCTQAEVAKSLMITPASVALSTKRMVKAGLLEKRMDADNLRYKRLYITEKGKQFSLRCREVFNKMDTVMLQGFTQDEINNLNGYIDRFIKNLAGQYSYNSDEMDFFSLYAMRNMIKSRRRKDSVDD